MGQTLSQNYKYKPLEIQDRHIRLLTLYPSEDESAPIKCSIAPHSLNWNPSYEALSYTWGSPKDTCPSPIDLNGRKACISANLDAALRALRYSEYPRILWVDALCINQIDLSEKNRQIPMMGAIFETARNVVIWLGPQSEDSDLAISTISTLNRSTDFGGITEGAWNALENLFSRAWFSRIWVIQEFKRGRNPIFQCGKASFNWDRTGKAFENLWKDGHWVDLKHFKLLGEIGKVVSMASTRLDVPIHADIDPRQSAQYLVRMLRIYGGCKATLAHDKIYGLLGLSNAFSFADSNPPPIDYDQPITDVYTNWARFLISTQNALDILYISQRMQRDPALPSWVPDWRTARHDLLLTLDVFRSPFRYTGQRKENLDTVPYFDGEGRLLFVKGHVIKTLTRSFIFSSVDPKYVTAKLSSQSPKDLLFACLMMGCKVEKATVEDFATMGISKGRKQFRSSSGANGLVPDAARHGDIICILGDSEIPFVLRPVGDEQYELVGDGYIELDDTLDFGHQPMVQTFAIR